MPKEKHIYDFDELEKMNLSSDDYAKIYRQSCRRNVDEDNKNIYIHLPPVDSEYYQKIISGENAALIKNISCTNKDIKRICDISSIQISHWLQSSVITPYQDTIGRGKVKRFSYQNIAEFMICRELNRFGLSVHIMRDLVERLRNDEYIFRLSSGEIDTVQRQRRIITSTIWHLYETFGLISHFLISLWPDLTKPGRMRCSVSNRDATELWLSDAPDESPQGIIIIRFYTLLEEINQGIEEAGLWAK